MKGIVNIPIPRLALNGGNLVAYALAGRLMDIGYKVNIINGFRRLPFSSELSLVAIKKGKYNGFYNLMCFLSSGIFVRFLGGKLILTHHLLSIFSHRGDGVYCLVQDREINFYPDRWRFIGKILWERYLTAGTLILTNNILARKCGARENVIGVPLLDSGVRLNAERRPLACRNYDVLLILRPGDYKNPVLSYKVAEILADRNCKVAIVSFMNDRIRPSYNITVFSTLHRSDFAELLLNSKVYICLSKWEGLGLPNFEAADSGCRVVSTLIPSAEILSNLDYPVSIVNCNEDPENIVNVVLDIIRQVHSVSTSDALEESSRKLSREFDILKVSWLKYAIDILEVNQNYEGSV